MATDYEKKNERVHRVWDDPMLQFFQYEHLPPHLQILSKQFHDLAHLLVAELPRNPERSAMLRKLLEAKDCAVRAALYQTSTPEIT